MTQKLQELTVQLLQELQKNEGLDPAIKDELEALLHEETGHISKKEELGEFPKMLNLKGQYVERLSTLRHYGLIGTDAPFNPERVQPPAYDTVRDSFSKEELEYALTFSQPTLLIIPEVSLSVKIKALESCKEKVLKHETYIHEDYKKTDIQSDKIVGWRAVIVDGIPEMGTVLGDDINAKFGSRIRKRNNERHELDKGMDRHKYCQLMMESVRAGSPIDQKMFTLLDTDPAFNIENVPAGDYDLNNNWVRFNLKAPDDINVCARFRPSVGGYKILK
ncbi:hypothetical protein JXD20_04095 [Candidatus Peregrinibacteria bacterium]|nr:hypothetical protein [Candidatus Peregrinibacteria bacterium]